MRYKNIRGFTKESCKLHYTYLNITLSNKELGTTIVRTSINTMPFRKGDTFDSKK